MQSGQITKMPNPRFNRTYPLFGKNTNNIKTMSNHPHTNPSKKQPTEAVEDIARETADAAKESSHMATQAVRNLTETTRNTAHHAADKAKEAYRSASMHADETLATSKEYVRSNPVPVVLGAVAFGAAMGCMVMVAMRKRTFGERYEDEPFNAVRDALLGALSPLTQQVHRGYDSARDGAGKAMGRMHGIGSGRTCNSFPDRMGRVGNNLKFW